MACKPICKICKHLVISTAVAFDGTEVIVTIPNGQYLDGEKYCIVVAQALPADATINAPVRININGIFYPLVKCNCEPLTICSLRTRTRYSTRLHTGTTPNTGTFRLLGKACDCPTESVPSIGG